MPPGERLEGMGVRGLQYQAAAAFSKAVSMKDAQAWRQPGE
jgi:hypothetical protein